MSILCEQKNAVHIYMKNGWEKIFKLNRGELCWSDIYTRKLRKTKCNKFAEFNFKLLHNILPCGKLVSIWDINTYKNCLVCHELESTQHMLYECPRVLQLWNNISSCLKINIVWEHIVLGYNDDSIVTSYLNIIINGIAYTIYKQWIICKQTTTNNFASTNLWNSCLKELKLYQSICDKTEHQSMYHLYKHILAKF